MFDQLSLFEILIGLAGLTLVINGIAIIFSSRYYGLFSKTFFIETFSGTKRGQLEEQIKSEHTQSRYVIGIFTIFFGSTAIAWALGFESALGWPFNLLF
jgi:hypothetical protein